MRAYASAVDLTSVCAALGLSAAAGLNAWLPLFGAALAERLDLVDLAQPFDDLSGTGALVVLGGSVAASIHAGRATIRPVSTVGTGGIGNPILSLVEDIGSAVLTLAAFVVPVLAALGVIALVVLILSMWRRRRHRGG